MNKNRFQKHGEHVFETFGSYDFNCCANKSATFSDEAGF